MDIMATQLFWRQARDGLVPPLSPHHLARNVDLEGVPSIAVSALNCGTGSIRSRCLLSHLHLGSSPQKIPTPVVTMRNPGFSDLPREKLYNVKPCCPPCPHDGANLHTINDPPTPPLFFYLYYTCFYLGLFQDLCLHNP